MLKMARTVGLQMQNESETEKKDAPSRTPTFVDFNGNRKQKDVLKSPTQGRRRWVLYCPKNFIKVRYLANT